MSIGLNCLGVFLLGYLRISILLMLVASSGSATPLMSKILGNQQSSKALLLVSGPTDHWHSDNGWFAGLVGLFGQDPAFKDYKVILVDRPGTQKNSGAPISYRDFGAKLNHFLKTQKITQLGILSFASGNLAVQELLKETWIQKNYRVWC